MWIIVPAKSPLLAKSRLAPVLSAEARAVLARLLLARLLTTLGAVEGVAGAVVVSDDAGLRAIARLFGYQSLPDRVPELNGALEGGRSLALAHGAQALLVLPTDLPWLTGEAVARLHALLPAGPGVVLARDHAGQGTNALLLRPADAIPFAFGPGSARQHAALAHSAGLPLVEVALPEVAFDLDGPDDWARLVA